MTEQDKLHDLIFDGLVKYTEIRECGLDVDADAFVDYLIANGATLQKHGRWDRNGYCSECDFWTCYCGDYNYCPNCGAKMREEEGK